jgi:hypothetical protein
MKTCPPTPTLSRSSVILAAIFWLPFMLTIVFIEPSSAQKQIPSEQAAHFVGYLGEVCGHVTNLRQDSKAGITFLYFGPPDEPSFMALISSRNGNAETNYEGERVCIAGRILNEWGGPEGVPSIRVTDKLQITIE